MVNVLMIHKDTSVCVTLDIPAKIVIQVYNFLFVNPFPHTYRQTLSVAFAADDNGQLSFIGIINILPKMLSKSIDADLLYEVKD